MSEIRDLLDAAAGGLVGPPDHDEIRRRGRRLIAARVAGVLGAVVVVAGLAAGVVLELTTEEPTPPIVEEPTPDPSPVDDEGAQACALPSLRPAYLPWLAAGEEVPEPVDARHGTDDLPDASLIWAEDPDAYDPDDPDANPNQVRISTLHAYDDPEELYGGVEVHGHPAHLVWIGDPGIGPVSLIWREADDPCGVHAINLLIRGSPDYLDLPPDRPNVDEVEDDEIDEWMLEYEEAIEAELVRIAESLEHAAAASAWTSDDDKDAWQAEYGEAEWLVGYFCLPGHEVDLGVLRRELSLGGREDW